MIIGTNSIFGIVGVTTKTAIFSMDTLICSHYFKILTSYVYIYIYLFRCERLLEGFKSLFIAAALAAPHEIPIQVPWTTLTFAYGALNDIF